jgi:hypothetical protein
MKFTDYFREQFDELSISRWSKDEITALMRVIHSLYVADNEFDKLERDYFIKKLDAFKIDVHAVDAMPMAEAFELLAKDKLKSRLAYVFMAEALFKDDDYDDLEASHIEALKQRFPLSEEMLDDAIKQVRNRKLEGVLKDWANDIQKTQL